MFVNPVALWRGLAVGACARIFGRPRPIWPVPPTMNARGIGYASVSSHAMTSHAIALCARLAAANIGENPLREELMDKVRLTTAQALVRYLCNQFTLIDGERLPLFAGVFAIFGHGN